MRTRFPYSTTPAMVVSWLDDIVYPAQMYREGACRIGADLLRMMLGIDVYDTLLESYCAGCELSIIRGIVGSCLPGCDARILVKVAAAMEAHQPKVSPYEDALETLPMLQALGIKLALVGEGSRIGQRLLVEKLGLKGLFEHMVYVDPQNGSQSWDDALLMLEVIGGLQRESAVILCAEPSRVRRLADNGWFVFHIARHPSCFDARETLIRHERVISACNLYDLPEALGLVAWNSGETEVTPF